MSAFWDASAVVPLCVPAQRSKIAIRLVRADVPVIWWGTPLEVQSALARLRSEGELSFNAYDAAKKRMVSLAEGWRQIQPTTLVRELAMAQLDRFSLRAGDALQLGAALVWVKQKPRGRMFITNDTRLAAAASAVGFDAQGV